MFTITINRYQTGPGNQKIVIEAPQRVTITGYENWFERATEDAYMAIRGLQALDELEGLTGDKAPRYTIEAIARHN